MCTYLVFVRWTGVFGRVLDQQGEAIFQWCLNQLTDSPVYKFVSHEGFVGPLALQSRKAMCCFRTFPSYGDTDKCVQR